MARSQAPNIYLKCQFLDGTVITAWIKYDIESPTFGTVYYVEIKDVIHIKLLKSHSK